jgi:tetratricopeptide (TPR) repeat protein
MHKPNPVRWLYVLAALAGLPVLAQTQRGVGTTHSAAGSPFVQPVPSAAGNQLNVPRPGSSSIEPQLTPAKIPQPGPGSPAVKTVQGPPPTPEEIADSLQVKQRYQAAIQAYAKIEHPSATVWNKMGISYQMMFNLKDAMRCYNESLKLNPRNALVMNNLATAYDAQKDYKRAEKLYRKALKISPKSAMILKNLGTNLLVQHKYKKGWKAYQEATAIDPDIFNDSSAPKSQNPASAEQRGALNYYMARGCLHSGQTACALDYLRLALNEGFTTAKKLASDSDFAALRDNPEFKELLASQELPRH